MFRVPCSVEIVDEGQRVRKTVSKTVYDLGF